MSPAGVANDQYDYSDGDAQNSMADVESPGYHRKQAELQLQRRDTCTTHYINWWLCEQHRTLQDTYYRIRSGQAAPAEERTASQHQSLTLASNRLTAASGKIAAHIKETTDAIETVNHPDFLTFVFLDGSGNTSGAAAEFMAAQAENRKAAGIKSTAAAAAATNSVNGAATVGAAGTEGDTQVASPVGSQKGDGSGSGEDEVDDAVPQP